MTQMETKQRFFDTSYWLEYKRRRINVGLPWGYIDELLVRVDIVSVISSYIPLKKKFRSHADEWYCCCPFHNEKTPSFTVTRTKQLYHCFGCGAGGRAIDFLMEYARMDYYPAVMLLARRAHFYPKQWKARERKRRK